MQFSLGVGPLVELPEIEREKWKKKNRPIPIAGHLQDFVSCMFRVPQLIVLRSFLGNCSNEVNGFNVIKQTDSARYVGL